MSIREPGRRTPAGAAPDAVASPSAFRCLVCGHATAEPFLNGCRDLYLRTPNLVDYYRCRECALVQQHPIPTDVSSFYDDYPIHREKSRLYARARRAVMSGAYRAPNQWRPGSRILDFGCGDGWYLQWCKESGLTVVGFEQSAPHADSLSRRLELEVFSDTTSLVNSYSGRFDVITLHFVVEHLTDLHTVFATLQVLLKPNGVIRYVVPNIASWEFALFGRRWHSLDPPRHISFPGETHAKRLAHSHLLEFDGGVATPFANGFGGSLSAAMLGAFNQRALIATLPLSVLVTRLWPGGNVAYSLRRPA